ncbi:MAG: hypothetical protein ACKPIC_36450, partial [Microcystis panniformis]
MSVEENLNPSDQGESYEEITSSEILGEPKNENNEHSEHEFSEPTAEQKLNPLENPQESPVISENFAVIDQLK